MARLAPPHQDAANFLTAVRPKAGRMTVRAQTIAGAPLWHSFCFSSACAFEKSNNSIESPSIVTRKDDNRLMRPDFCRNSRAAVPVFAVAAVLLTVALFSTPAAAAPIPMGEAYSIYFQTETCDSCWPGESSLPDVTIAGFLTVVPVTGASFWDPMYGDGAWPSGLMVTDISGNLSLDCMALAGCFGDGAYSLSFLPAPNGDGSYLLSDIPRYLVFSAAGSGLNTRIINDNAYNLMQWSSPTTGFGTQTPISWSAVSVPEPSSLSLLAVGLIGVTLFKRRRRSRLPK